jgi:pimeloyl-ACP methyl ester carboxylesterase
MSLATSLLACVEGGAVSRSIVSVRSEASRDQLPGSSSGDPISRLSVDCWGSGVPVVLVHGSLATGADEWQAQRPLAGEGFRLMVPDRRGYGRSPAALGEDFLIDGEDIVELMGDGAHLVGHSYGGLGVMFAAARRPDATLSLTLLEPSAFSLGQRKRAARALVADVRRLWDQDLPDEEWVVRFLRIVGSDPDALSPELVAAAVPLAPVLRRGRPIWEPELPLGTLASAAFPKLVVSGGHSAGLNAICNDLAERIGASRMVIEGAGHEIQFTGGLLNEALRTLWRGAGSTAAKTALMIAQGD